MEIGEAEKFSIKRLISGFIDDAKRIFVVSKKPTWDDYKRMTLIVALGMVLIGIIGFVVYFFFALTGWGF